MILFCMDILLVALVIQAANTFFFFRSHRALLFSSLALRQPFDGAQDRQLTVYNRKQRRPVIKNRDRLFWAFLSRLWPDWRSVVLRKNQRYRHFACPNGFRQPSCSAWKSYSLQWKSKR